MKQQHTKCKFQDFERHFKILMTHQDFQCDSKVYLYHHDNEMHRHYSEVHHLDSEVDHHDSEVDHHDNQVNQHYDEISTQHGDETEWNGWPDVCKWYIHYDSSKGSGTCTMKSRSVT